MDDRLQIEPRGFSPHRRQIRDAGVNAQLKFVMFRVGVDADQSVTQAQGKKTQGRRLKGGDNPLRLFVYHDLPPDHILDHPVLTGTGRREE